MVGFERSALPSDALIINFDRGDPTMFEEFWKKMGGKCRVEIEGSDLMSYFSDVKNPCWYLDPQLGDAIRRLHRVTGNAVVDDDRSIVVGTGSSQLFHAALYALTAGAAAPPPPVSVVCASPYYSSYKEQTEFLRSGLYQWAGDAYSFDTKGPYIEVVTSPNNPDGSFREAVVHRDGGKLIHDLAYYWPQYCPITAAADHDLMLFTFSKCTGHAGSRIGWAIVKDKEVARKMVKYMELTSIGVSKESQLRAAKILGVLCDGCDDRRDNFFEFGRRRMTERWERLKEVIKDNPTFTLPKYPREFCNFTGAFIEPSPAFAWVKSKEGLDSEAVLMGNYKMVARGGKKFGVDSKYARLSMLSSDDEFNQLLLRFAPPMIKKKATIINMINNGNI